MSDAFTIVTPDALPAHSPLGASSADRWMHCPGSVTLGALFKGTSWYADDDPDYRRDGTQAHALAAHCLEHGWDAWEGTDHEDFPDLTVDMMSAVQMYLDYARSRKGKRSVELKMHEPDFHPLAFSTLDCVHENEEDEEVENIDYKHGEGIYVEVVENPQLMYYLLMYVFKKPHIKDHWKAKLTIVQPRLKRGGPAGIRTWETTVGYIREWAENVLRPAMEVTKDAEYLELGSWCRFCPAKLVCPAYDGLANKALHSHVDSISYTEALQLEMLVKAVKERTMRRLLAGEVPEEVGAKLVKKRTFRVFKGAAPVAAIFGDDAWDKSLKGPAGIEKLPGGKAFVAQWAFTPETDGVTVAPLNDTRAEATKPKTLAEKYGKKGIDTDPA